MIASFGCEALCKLPASLIASDVESSIGAHIGVVVEAHILAIVLRIGGVFKADIEAI